MKRVVLGTLMALAALGAPAQTKDAWLRMMPGLDGKPYEATVPRLIPRTDPAPPSALAPATIQLPSRNWDSLYSPSPIGVYAPRPVVEPAYTFFTVANPARGTVTIVTCLSAYFHGCTAMEIKQ